MTFSNEQKKPEEIFGVPTSYMDEFTWSWLSRLSNHSRHKPIFENQVFLVTGGVSGIGEKICVLAALLGASVYTLDIDKNVETKFTTEKIIGKQCDIADFNTTRSIVREIGNNSGITKVVLNAGIFPNPRPTPGEFNIADFVKVMNINAFGNIAVCDAAMPYLWSMDNNEYDPTVAIIGSRNLGVPSHASYTLSKAALAQYGSYLSHLSVSKESVQHRVYMEHPDAIFDTNVWGKDDEDRKANILASAKKKGLTLEQYLHKSNPMHIQLTSWKIAASVVDMLLPMNRGKHGVSVHHNGGVYIANTF